MCFYPFADKVIHRHTDIQEKSLHETPAKQRIQSFTQNRVFFLSLLALLLYPDFPPSGRRTSGVFLEDADDPVIGPQQPPCQEQPIYDQPHSQGQYRHCLSRPFRQQFQDNAGTRGVHNAICANNLRRVIYLRSSNVVRAELNSQ